MRFNNLKHRVGDKPQHYLNQIEKCGPDKRLNRIETFYRLAVESGLENTAKAIKEAYPESYFFERNSKAKEEMLEKQRIEKEEKDFVKKKQELRKNKLNKTL